MKKREKGITLITLAVTIMVLAIIAGISITAITNENGTVNEARKANNQAEKESIIEKIEADIYTEKVKKGRNLTKTEAETIIGTFGTINQQDKQLKVKTKDYEYTISFDEIIGWNQASSILPKEEGITEPYYPSNNFEQVQGTDLTTGLVIEEKTTKNRYTWVEVPKTIYTTAKSSTDYGNIEKDMQTYASAYRNSYTDTWYSESQHGFASKEKYDEHKNKMLKSVYEHGGFWISQYEIGYEETTIRTEKTDDIGLVQKPVSKEGAYPYNWVTCKQAQKLATQMGTGEYTSSLMFGIQWDLIMQHIQEGGKPQGELKGDSNNWGNYINANFDVTRGKYSEDSGGTFNLVGNGTYKKPVSKSILLTTGATERNSFLNIYDISGNVGEWTLQYSAFDSFPCANRGGNCKEYSYNKPAFSTANNPISNSNYYVGFRTVLYK